MSISLLLPSRGRYKELKRMIDSACATAKGPIEIVVRVDEDDLTYVYGYELKHQGTLNEGSTVKWVEGPRIRNLTQCWNECFEACSGDIVCQANDDIVFTTEGWDRMVEDAFGSVPDRILLVHGNDVFGHGDRFGPHAFVHRRWVEALGYFIPPYFTSDFGDAWINELADRIGRRRYVPFDVEHHHYSYQKCEADQNTRERLARHQEDDPDSLYYSPEKTAERVRDAEKLAALMDGKVDTKGWAPQKSSGVLSRGKCLRCGSVMTVLLPDGKQIFCNHCGCAWSRP